jgi:subtilase family serine protease
VTRQRIVSTYVRASWKARLIVVSAVAIGIVSVGVSTGASSAGAAVASGVRVGNVPALPSGAVLLGSLPQDSRLSILVSLKSRDASGLAKFAESVSTPGTSVYRHYMTVEEFADAFGATRNDVNLVREGLRSVGLPSGSVSADDLFVSFAATAQQLARAFSITFNLFRLQGGRTVFVNTAAPRIPAVAAPYVSSVIGLDDVFQAQAHSSLSGAGGSTQGGEDQLAAAATKGPSACSTAATFAKDNDAYTANQIAAAYGFTDLYSAGDLGSGQTVGVLEYQGWSKSDVAKFQSCYATKTTITTVSVDGGPGANSGVGEADGDIEDIVGLAPKVDIIVYQAPNNGTGWIKNIDKAVSSDKAKVLSISWGGCEQLSGNDISDENTIFEESASLGESFFAAAGDSGSEDCLGPSHEDDYLAVDDPGSQPYITDVGGTQWTSAKTPPAEKVWNDHVLSCGGVGDCFGAGGGGISENWSMPSYQTGAASSVGVINADSSGTPCSAPSGTYCREVPDVSALAGEYPFTFYITSQWESWGGTSFATPLWAAFTALTNASTACSGTSVGFANPKLYDIAGTDPSAFNDIKTGKNDITGDNGGLYPALKGYDMASGLGTPNVSVLSQALCSAG